MLKSAVNVLDESLESLKQGKAVETCVVLNGETGQDIKPLLYTADYLLKTAKAEPSGEFRRTARGRLMARLQQETCPAPVHRREFRTPLRDGIARAFSQVSLIGSGTWKIAVPAVVTLIVIAVSFLGASGMPDSPSQLASRCTLSVLSGTVDVQMPQVEGNLAGTNGMTLEVGTRVATSPDSRALLTFFDGSTLTVEPATVVEIEQLKAGDDESVSIVLDQLMGSTWSRVVKMVDAESSYEIHTPSAVALVRGTFFHTQVDSAGQTRVETAEGLVSVFGQGEEVYVPVGKKTIVKPGKTPTMPVTLNIPDDEAPELPPGLGMAETGEPRGVLIGIGQGQDKNENSGQGQDKNENNDQSQDKNENSGQGQDKNENSGQGQDKNENSGQSQDKNENSGQGQDRNENSGQGQDKSENNGQGQDKNENNGQGQDKNGNGNAKKASVTPEDESGVSEMPVNLAAVLAEPLAVGRRTSESG